MVFSRRTQDVGEAQGAGWQRADFNLTAPSSGGAVAPAKVNTVDLGGGSHFVGPLRAQERHASSTVLKAAHMQAPPLTVHHAGMTQGSDQSEEKLVRGETIGLRLWQDEPAGTAKDTHASPYETVGYVLKGRAELIVNGQTQHLGPGDSYLVPKNAPHTYHILESFSAVEATSPPAD